MPLRSAPASECRKSWKLSLKVAIVFTSLPGWFMGKTGVFCSSQVMQNLRGLAITFFYTHTLILQTELGSRVPD
eukprot:1160112-Pelagomonas_calceolata.AAC.7